MSFWAPSWNSPPPLRAHWRCGTCGPWSSSGETLGSCWEISNLLPSRCCRFPVQPLAPTPGTEKRRSSIMVTVGGWSCTTVPEKATVTATTVTKGWCRSTLWMQPHPVPPRGQHCRAWGSAAHLPPISPLGGPSQPLGHLPFPALLGLNPGPFALTQLHA